jgi:hypothetical protein
VDFPASISSLRDQYRADFAKSLADLYVIPKIRAFQTHKAFKNLPRTKQAISLFRQAFRALFSR